MNQFVRFLFTPPGLVFSGGTLIVLVLLAQSLNGSFSYLLVALVLVALLALIINVIWHWMNRCLEKSAGTSKSPNKLGGKLEHFRF